VDEQVVQTSTTADRLFDFHNRDRVRSSSHAGELAISPSVAKHDIELPCAIKPIKGDGRSQVEIVTKLHELNVQRSWQSLRQNTPWSTHEGDAVPFLLEADCELEKHPLRAAEPSIGVDKANIHGLTLEANK
jgi:hypothetical protein